MMQEFAGINIEDSLPNKNLRTCESFQKIISSISVLGIKKNMPLFINARTDSFLLKDTNALSETISRVKAYEAVGAHGIFVPYLCEINDIKKIVEATSLPVSVFCTANLPDFKTLLNAGIKRVSMGTSLFRYLNNSMNDVLLEILDKQSAASLF